MSEEGFEDRLKAALERAAGELRARDSTSGEVAVRTKTAGDEPLADVIPLLVPDDDSVLGESRDGLRALDSLEDAREESNADLEDIEDPEERAAILRSCGIDPVAALARYEEELESDDASTVARALRCARCERTGDLDEVRYEKGELLCRECADAAQVARRREESDEKKRARVDAGRAPDADAALSKALLYGFLFFCGIAGPLGVVFDMWLLALLVGAVVAALGSSHIYKVSLA